MLVEILLVTPGRGGRGEVVVAVAEIRLPHLGGQAIGPQRVTHAAGQGDLDGLHPDVGPQRVGGRGAAGRCHLLVFEIGVQLFQGCVRLLGASCLGRLAGHGDLRIALSVRAAVATFATVSLAHKHPSRTGPAVLLPPTPGCRPARK